MKRRRTILFVEPRSPREHVFSRVHIPRLGSVLLATILRDAGYAASVWIEEVAGQITKADLAGADVVGLSSTTTTAPRAYRLADGARAAGKVVVHGGPHVTFLPDEALAHGDFVVRGEGEATIVELLAALDAGGDFGKIQGLSYREGGATRHNPARPLLANLDALPIPDFSLARGWNPKQAILPIATSRGCPHACTFCSVVPMFGRGYRTRSVDHVLEEVRCGRRLAPHLFFCDDNFFANPARAKELLRRMRDEGPPRLWSTQVRAESAGDEEFLRLLRETNCFAVYVGFESANPEALRAFRKRQEVEQMRAAIAAFHAAGVRVHGMFILGSDRDTPETIAQTVRFAKVNRIDSVQFLTLTPLPGTETFRELEEAGRLLTRDWELYDGAHAVYRPRAMTAEELQRAWYRAYLAFYSLRSAAVRLLHFDFFYSYLRLHARRLVTRGRAHTRAYTRRLRREFLEESRRRLGTACERGKIRCVALLPADTLGEHRRFIVAFLRRLGVEVVEGLGGLGFRTQLVIVPVVKHAREGGKEAVERLCAARKLPANLKAVEVDFDLRSESLYRACARFGVLFSQNTRAVRRAYDAALRDHGPLPGTGIGATGRS